MLNTSSELKHVISINQFSREDLLQILELSREYKHHPPKDILKGKVIASLFFEPSTRTRLSFETAILKMGGQIIGFSDDANTAVKKGESLEDTIRVIGSYADAIVMRHPAEGSAKLASEAVNIPVINGGDGANQHPTQTLIDLFSIQESQGRIDGLSIAWVGDLKNGRTVHSLVQACRHFGIRMYFVSPKTLTLPEAICEELKKHGVVFSFHREIEEIIDRVDILYMTRLQKERLKAFEDHNYGNCVLTESMMVNVKDNMRVLHPLPRVDEIEKTIDKTPHAYYFEQAANGVPVRQALLKMVLQGD